MLSSANACKLLDIKPATLYAYVSRGWVRTSTDPNKPQSRLYSKEDIDRLLVRSRAKSGTGPIAASSLRFGDPVIDSSITNINNGHLYYRGHDVEKLIANNQSFESVAELLWTGVLPNHLPYWQIQTKDSVPKSISMLDSGSWPKIASAFLIQFWNRTQIDAPVLLDTTLAEARAVIHAICDATSTHSVGRNKSVVSKHQRVESNKAHSIALRLMCGKGQAATENEIHAVNAALILVADHELNASTFSARIAASTGSSLPACLLAAVATFSGTDHGNAPLRLFTWLESFANVSALKREIEKLTKAGHNIPGFGHPLYPKGDPRSKLLLHCIKQIQSTKRSNTRLLSMFDFLEIIGPKIVGEFPNIDFAIAYLAAYLNLAPEMTTSIFGTGRMAGWIAHVLEQRQAPYILRPRARYVGMDRFT